MMMHANNIDSIISKFNTDKSSGLDNEQVIRAESIYGLNALRSRDKKTLLSMVIDQFKDFMIIILIIAAIISIALGDKLEGIVILGIVILNAVLGTYQENKASNALDALKKMAAPKAKVIRNGKLESIPAKNLVPGDLAILETGDYVPADVRLTESINLRIDESALTGESIASEKDASATVSREASLGDRINCAYMSTIVVYGRGRGIITATGMNTEIGHIARMLDETEDTQTPLQKKLAEFGKFLGITCILISIFIFMLGILRGEDMLEFFMIAVSLAVAAIPEGLPAVVTVVLAMGMQRMVKKNAIMKQLGAVETLGSTSTICTDKTGTLTQNKMTVIRVFSGTDEWNVTGTGYGFEGEFINNDSRKNDLAEIAPLFQAAVLCNDADIKGDKVIGDPTEGALIVLGAKAGYLKDELNRKYPRIRELPFDSVRKMMSTLHEIDGRYIMFTKGAADSIIDCSGFINQHGQVKELTEKDKEIIISKQEEYAENAMRVLGYAYKIVDKDAILKDEEKDLILTGISGMVDPPRNEAKDAVALCKKAGIRVVLITGDHVKTAGAVASELGILDEGSVSMPGAGINKLSDEELGAIVKNTSVFARVSPDHKVRIVTAIRSNGEITAMTGDGVNDAPALKKADIGIAMGITGTDVSREAADMILTDDNFASIVDAVKEGRIIYSNIRKFVGFLLSCNIGEILIILTAILLKWPVPLLPIQLLWVNLITDSFPAFALGLEKGENDIMDKKPRDRDEPIINRKMAIGMAFQSIGLAFASLFSFWIGYSFFGNGNADLARTFCFATLIAGEMLRAYSARSENKGIFSSNPFANSFLNISVAGAFFILILVIYVPFISGIFSTVPLSFSQFAIAVSLGIIPTIFSEISKILK